MTETRPLRHDATAAPADTAFRATTNRHRAMTLDPSPSYPASHAFVVKLHRSSRPAMDVWQGRVESMVHGEQHDFASAAELLSWLAQMSPKPRAPINPRPAADPMPFSNDGATHE
jgi:hypothetical protein